MTNFKCEGCKHTLPSEYSIRTENYCYLCDPNVTVDELLKERYPKPKSDMKRLVRFSIFKYEFEVNFSKKRKLKFAKNIHGFDYINIWFCKFFLKIEKPPF